MSISVYIRLVHFLFLQVFHFNWVFDTKLTLEGESTTYRFAVIRGVMGKAGVETGLRRVYTLNRIAPPEVQEDGVEVEPEAEKESEPMVEESIETPTEETPEVEEEIPPSEEPPAEEAPPLEEVAAEEVPAAEEPPVVEEVPEEVEVVETEEPIAEESVSEPEPEPEVEAEVEIEAEIEVEKVEDFKMEFDPETPVFVENNQPVIGTLFGFEPNEPLHVTIEKSTSEENGWVLWTERNVKLSGERTPA